VLSTLAMVRWINPDRLAAAVGMPVDLALAWVSALHDAGLTADGWRAPLGWELALAASPAGRDQLERWRAGLESRAAGLPVC
jgi:hypothetical protein